MKKSMRRFFIRLASISLGIYMMFAPFALTVYADTPDQPISPQTQTIDQKVNKEILEQHAKAYYERHKNDANNKLPPLDIVKAFLNELGFDLQNDVVSLVIEKNNIAVVQFIHDDVSYHISVVRPDQGHSWIVSSID